MNFNPENKIFCPECYDYLKEAANDIKFPLEALGMDMVHDDSVDCDICNSEILQEAESYLVPEHVLENMGDTLSEDIGGCQHCEGDRRSAMVNAYNNDPFDRTSRMDESITTGTSVSYHLQENGVPFELVDLFAKLIVCRCGYGRDRYSHKHNPDGGIFEPEDDIFTQSSIADFWGFDIPEFLEFTEQYGIDLSTDDFIDFRDHLIHYPMLGTEHETGKKILEALRIHFDQNKYVPLCASSILFRGRTRKKDSQKPYSVDGMWSPPPGLPQHGRFNTIGVPVLYVTNKLDGLPFEVHPASDDLLDIAEFELQKDLKLFDIGVFNKEFTGFFNEVNEESKPLKKAYLLPNFIGICCSYIGYDGVQYNGVHLSAGTYTNYALFNMEQKHLPTVNPIVTYDPEISYRLKKITQNTEF
ncbi:RES domain-containing protein [Paenibacillus sinopodophylli]|uniref:RES domain-containing protein n=1 Tax=Paenibacillus sinopodophylli TaxID=1837342 RepID=UPI00110D0ACD|nr:RES domain-containing protein [Paenibacillus sinopodophylli]